MKKIIIILMGISMMLVSCSTPTTPTTDTSTVSTNGTESGSDNGNNGGNTSTPSNPTNPTTQYTVTFNSNGGSSVTSQTVSPNGHATRPTNPTKTDCEFADWYEGSNTNTPFNFDSAINGNITLNAKWYMHYFELEDGETVNSFTYKVKFSSNNVEYNAILTYDTSYHLVYGNGTNGIVDIELKNTNTEVTKIIFINHDNLYKVGNVTVDRDRNTTPKPTVTIELVYNN